jgi:uncharacterized protein YjbJ (UPF0337 family)
LIIYQNGQVAGWQDGMLIAPAKHCWTIQYLFHSGAAFQKEACMGLPNRDEIEGKFDQAKGATKEAVGRVVNDRDLEHEGQADQAGGDLQEGFGKARRKVGEAIEDIGDAIGS